MDGNRRWAKAEHKPALFGHRAGLDTAHTIVDGAFSEGVEFVTLYALSTENLKRSAEEVAHLFGLIEVAFDTWLDEFIEEGGRVRFIGDRALLPERVVQKIEAGEEKSRMGTKGTLVVALSYGGRAEIVSAVNALMIEDREQISEDDLRNALWSKDIPDPDLIIRTGGDQRLSNFLTWQSVYSELMFTKTLWPAYSIEEFKTHLQNYAERKRNFGV